MFIYCIRNKLNGKCYIGQDSAPVEKLARAKTHFALANFLLAGGTPKHESKIARAIAKYGAENFEVEVLTHCQTKTELDDVERYLIKALDTIRGGYNILPGGQGLPKNSEIDDADLLSHITEVRRRGARTANAKRWQNSTAQDRKLIGAVMKAGYNDGERSQKIAAHWSSLSVEQRATRAAQMKAGRPYIFVLFENGKEKYADTNLRTVLSATNGKMPRRPMENAVRNTGVYDDGYTKIERRKNA